MTRAKPDDLTGQRPPPWAPRQDLRTAHMVGRSFRCGMLAVKAGDRTAWAFAWQELAGSSGGESDVDRLVDHLALFVSEVDTAAARPIQVLPRGCPGLCRDECLAVSIVAASQIGACPALKACTFALLECGNVQPCLKAAEAFGGALREAGHVLTADQICNALAYLPTPSGRMVPHA